MMEFFNLEAYGHTLQIGYQIYLTRLAKALEKMKLQKTASRNKKIKSSVSYLYDRQRPGVLAKENDGKKTRWSPWKIGAWSFPMELSVSFTSSWVKLIERNWFKSRMFMDFESEQLLKKFRQILFLLIFCLPLSWASVTRCCWMVQKKSKQITDDYWRVLLQSTFLNADFMTLFHFYRQN